MCLTCITLQAQEMRHHEVGISIGCGPNDADTKVNDMLDILSDKYQMEEDFTQSGPFCMVHSTISIDYLYHLSRRWAVGGLFGWGYAGGNFNGNVPSWPSSPQAPNGPDDFPIFREGHLISRSFYILPFARFSWYVTDNQVFRCYSKLAIGFMKQVNDFRPSADQNEQQIGDLKPIYRIDRRLTFQVAVGGIEFGNQRIRLYSEMGYGCQGILTVGAKLAL